MKYLFNLLFLILLFGTDLIYPQTTSVTICDEIEIVISHPATYVQEKVKRGGISCLLAPHCCAPTWPLSPECYVYQTIKTGDAWEEIKKDWSCEDYSLDIEDAFERWLRNLTNPTPNFQIVTGDLTTLFGGYVLAAYEVAKPLDENIKKQLEAVSEKEWIPFTKRNVGNVKYLESDHPLAKRLWPPMSPLAITYYNLVIIDKDVLALKSCDKLALWSHELVHVNQYNQLGWENFLQEYLIEGIKGYNHISFEVKAKFIEDQVLNSCLISPPISAITFIGTGLNYSDRKANWVVRKDYRKYLEMNKFIAKEKKSKRINVIDGRIVSANPSGLERIIRKYPSTFSSDIKIVEPPKTKPNLLINSLDVSSSGSKRLITTEIKNIGNKNSNGFDVLFKLSGKTIPTIKRVQTVKVNGLGMGEKAVLNPQLTVPYLPAPHNKFLLEIKIDPEDKIHEWNEDNNFKALTVE